VNSGDAPLPGMVGSHPLMREVYRLVRQAAPTDLPVAIVGETGVGKELVARALHDLSPRRSGPFIAVNAAALPETLFESELFGHERGAFSDARVAKSGLLEVAHRGTFYCDELGAVPSACQAKLLRVIEEGVVRRVGGVTPRPGAPRWVISCQGYHAASRVGAGMRPDLWHRVSAVVIALPPLRARAADIPALVEHFLAEQGLTPTCITAEALKVLTVAPWAGNVRELKQVVARLVLRHDGHGVSADAVRRELEEATQSGRVAQGAEPPAPTVEQLLAVCEAHGWQARRIAAALGLGRTTLFKRLKVWGLSLRALREFTLVHGSSLNSRGLR